MALGLRSPAASPSPAPSSSPPSRVLRRPPSSFRCYFNGDGGGFRKNYDRIPKQFREENLKDGRELASHYPPYFPVLSADKILLGCATGLGQHHTHIVPAVTELIATQFLWLDYDDRTKPIYLYVNSTGTTDENNELVASETDAYAIADFINAKELDTNTDYYLDLVCKGVGRPKEELPEFLKGPRYFQNLMGCDAPEQEKLRYM
ncbi:hypothetical protein ABZP36_030060 [Zizania latifolia]